MQISFYQKLILWASLLAILLVGLGAYVRLSDAGLGCPDWPGCYGTLTVPQSEHAIADANQAYPDRPVEHGKAWKEMAHRYVAGVLGLLILLIFVKSWRLRQYIHVSPWLPSFLMLWVVFQAMLGMWTVTMLLMPAIVTMHLIGGMTTLGLLVWISHRHNGEFYVLSNQYAWLRRAIRFGLVLIAAQIILGGWTSTNYAGLACTDFPLCHGAWMPAGMDFTTGFDVARELGKTASGENMALSAYTAIQWTHRVGALLVFVYFALLAWLLKAISGLQRDVWRITILLVLQISLGIANLVLHLPVVLAVAHNVGAALLLTQMVILNSRTTRKQRG